MKNNLGKLLLLVIIVSVNSVFASNLMLSSPLRGEIKGKIFDAVTKKPLPGVNVFIEHTTIGAASNAEGEYHITKAPIGKNIHLVASMIGYRMNNKTIQVLTEETVIVNFELQPTILELGAVVVTGTGTPHIIEDMPVRTEVIPRRLIEQKQACNLAEALAFQTGVRVENNCQNCNFSQVRILGMDGKYSQILIDGDPVVSSLASVYGLEHFPEEMVDQIEIVKGGGSSLYGSGAIAGVINMITRRPLLNQMRIKYLNNLTEGKMDQRIGAVAETVNKGGTSGAYVFGSTRIRDHYDYNGDGFSELGDLRNESIGFKWYYRPFATGELLTSFHRIHEERRGGNKFDLPVHEAEIAEWIEHWRSGGTVRWHHQVGPLFDYRFFFSYAFLNRKSYYGGLGGETDRDRLDALAFYGRTENLLHISGIQVNYRYRGHLLTTGLQYSREKLVDETSAVTAYYIDEIYRNTGIFLQDNLHFGSEQLIELVAGMRMDKHSKLNNWIFSPRINGKFRLGKGFTLRGSFTTGFKAPQIYDEDLHLCGIEGDQRIIRNSKDLKEERSNFFSGGIEYQTNNITMPLMVSFTVFLTNLKGAFAEEFVSKQGVIERWERVNSDGAQVKGVEFDLGIRPASFAEIRCGFTYKKSQYNNILEDFNTKNFLRTPDLSGNVRLSLEATSKLSLFLAGNYVGKADIPHEVVVEGQEEPELLLKRSDSFFQIDFGLTYQLPFNRGLGAKLYLGIKNVTNVFQDDLDKGPNRDPAYVYGPVRPRAIYFGIETAF